MMMTVRLEVQPFDAALHVLAAYKGALYEEA